MRCDLHLLSTTKNSTILLFPDARKINTFVVLVVLVVVVVAVVVVVVVAAVVVVVVVVVFSDCDAVVR